MQIFISKLQHRSKVTYILLLFWLLSILIVIGKTYAANDSEFIQLNSELNDDFYKSIHSFSSFNKGTPSDSEEIRKGNIRLLPYKKGSILLPEDWSDLTSQVGIQYAWKSSRGGQRFFDYINTSKPPLKVATSREQYLQDIAKNSTDYDIYIGVTTAILKQQQDNEEDLSRYGYFGIYQLPKLDLDFNQGMLADLFSKDQLQANLRNTNKEETATIHRLIILGVINGKWDWKTNKSANNDGLVIKNSDNTVSKVLRLPGGLSFSIDSVIEAAKDKTGLKITSANAIIAGNIYNSGQISGKIAVELGEDGKEFPLLSLRQDKNPTFENNGIIKTHDPHGVAFKIKGGSSQSIPKSFDINNGGRSAKILGKIQSSDTINVTVINNNEITVPADNNAILIDNYEAKEQGRLIIEFDDTFGNISENTTLIKLNRQMFMSPHSKIILSKADHVKINSDTVQKPITLIKSEGGLFTKIEENTTNDFDKHLNNILCLKTFTANDKKFVLFAHANIDSKNTEVTAELKVVEVKKDAPDIIPLSKVGNEIIMPLTTLTPAHEKIKYSTLTPAQRIIEESNLTPAQKIIEESNLTPAQKSIIASELTPAHKIMKASELTVAHEISEYMPFNQYTSKDYYKNLIVRIKNKGAIKKIQVKSSNNSLTNKEGYLNLSKGIDVKQLVTILDDVNADTEISHQHSLLDEITFEYLDNIKKTGHLTSSEYDLADSTLYLGLTVYKKLHSQQYELGVFNYISNNKNPAFEFDLGFTGGFNKVAMYKNKIQLKNIIVTSILDSTSSQQAALLINNNSGIDKSLNLAKGLVVANTGKLLASNKNNSKAALVISSNKEKTMLDETHTTGNEKLTTKHLISGGIYNYGLISGNIAIDIGEHGCFFPLKTDSDSSFLDNHGQIISNNIAVKIAGKQTEFTKQFNLTNQKQGIIEGRLQEEKDFTSNNIEFNVVNHGVIKIPAENNSICVSNYNNTKDSTLIIEFTKNEISTNDSIINIEKHADFDLNSSVVFDFKNYNVDLTEHDIMHIPLVSSNKFTGNKDKLFYVKPIINDDEYILYNVEINHNMSSNDNLELEIISKEVFNLDKEPGIIKSFPSGDIKVTNIANKIKTLKMLVNKNKTYKEQKIKKLHDAFIGTHIVNHALENSQSFEEYKDYLDPNNASQAQLSNQKIFSNVTSQIYSRVMNKNIYSKYFYLQKLATNIDINEYAQNVELWSSTSYHLWNNKERNSPKHKIKNYLLSIGCDYELANDTIVGIVYGISHTKSMTHGEHSSLAGSKDIITTNSFSMYSKFNLKLIDGFAIISCNKNNHNVKMQSDRKTKFQSSTYALNIGGVYTTFFYDFHLYLSGLIGISSLNVAEHDTKYDDLKSLQPIKNLHQSDTLINMSIGPTIYNKIYLDQSLYLDYSFSINYNFLSGPKVSTIDSHLINSQKEKSHLPNKHNLNLNILTKLFLNEHTVIELTLDSTIERNSTEYGVVFAFRYLF